MPRRRAGHQPGTLESRAAEPGSVAGGRSRTRKGKAEGALDFTALLREWEETSRKAELGTLRGLARVIWHATPRTHAGAAQMAAQLALRGLMTHAPEKK